MLQGIEGLAASAVFGVPDERLGERVVAVVEKSDDGEVTVDACATSPTCWSADAVASTAMPRAGATSPPAPAWDRFGPIDRVTGKALESTSRRSLYLKL